jgi:hypothetical protein
VVETRNVMTMRENARIKVSVGKLSGIAATFKRPSGARRTGQSTLCEVTSQYGFS